MTKLKQLSPELSALCARVVSAKYQIVAARETKELRELMVELIRRGRKPESLIKTLLTGDTSDVAANPTTNQTTTDIEGQA